MPTTRLYIQGKLLENANNLLGVAMMLLAGCSYQTTSQAGIKTNGPDACLIRIEIPRSANWLPVRPEAAWPGLLIRVNTELSADTPFPCCQYNCSYSVKKLQKKTVRNFISVITYGSAV